MIKFRWSGTNKMVAQIDRMVQKAETGAENLGEKAANMLITDVRQNWSGTYPPASSPGEPPAQRTGNLDSSAKIERRAAGGRFGSSAGADTVFAVRWSAAEGNAYHGRGDYAPYLEDGTGRMKARPFLRPAIERLDPILIDMAKREIL